MWRFALLCLCLLSPGCAVTFEGYYRAPTGEQYGAAVRLDHADK